MEIFVSNELQAQAREIDFLVYDLRISTLFTIKVRVGREVSVDDFRHIR
jgi:hypothetical protein